MKETHYKLKHRVTALFAAAVMLCSMLPGAAFAEEPTPQPTEETAQMEQQTEPSETDNGQTDESSPDPGEDVTEATPETAEEQPAEEEIPAAVVGAELYTDLPDAPIGSYIGSEGLPVATGETKIGISEWPESQLEEGGSYLTAVALDNDGLTMAAPLLDGADYEDAIKLAFAIVNNTKPKDTPSGGDKFWDDSSVLLISALILYLMYEAPASEQNFSTLMYMILNCQVSENEMVENPLMMLFGELERRDPQHPAVLQFKSFMLGAKKTLQSILISAAANLYMFNSRKFAEMTSRDEMFLPRMGLEQRALFIVLPDNDTTFNFIATMLYTQLFDQLFRLADSTPEYNGALPVHVRLMMDEFANVALPKNFKNILAVCRSRNISCDIILQNIAQLKSLFKDDWEGIIGNCDTLLYLGGNEYGTYEYLSKILGKETERTKSQSIGKGSRGSSSDSLQTAGRELCMPDEIRRMRDDECLLLMRSEDPVIDKKYNLLHHPNVKYTPDAGGEPYVMPPDYMGDAVTITMDAVAAATAPEITEEMYEQLDYLEKHPEENYYENEENFSQYDQGD